MLAHWVRAERLLTLQEAVHRLSGMQARTLGLKDRGTLALGMRADVNVFDADKVAEHHPEMVHDLPGGARRFNQRSTGYLATLVNGQINVLNGEHTGLRAGKVLRHRQ